MYRGPLADPNARGQFAGHETFPLRHLWLRKAYDAVVKRRGTASRGVFSEPAAIANFGVGKNMVSSIRHWALACDVICEVGGGFAPTDLGHFLFKQETGRDPYMESQTTAWLAQWLVAGRWKRSSTWYYAFNYFTAQTFDRESLVRPILDLCRERGWPRTSAATIKRDVECFVRSYVPRTDGGLAEDALEPVLAEIGLIRALDARSFEFRRGPKRSLPDGVFLFALNDFWQRSAPAQNTLAVESLAYEPGSPGRVFKLDEFSLIERLARIEQSSAGRFLWSDTAGIRNVARRSDEVDAFDLLDLAYESKARRAA
jgi:hypothetical protein